VIERLVIAGVIVAGMAAVGWLLRCGLRARTRRRAAAVTLPATEGALLLVFSTRFCADCVTQKRVIEESRTTWQRPVEVQFHDAVADGELANRLGILTVPALVTANADGSVIDVHQGLVDGDRLRSLIEAAA
jgi:thioredoxin-like negative regulator of GroEL